MTNERPLTHAEVLDLMHAECAGETEEEELAIDAAMVAGAAALREVDALRAKANDLQAQLDQARSALVSAQEACETYRLERDTAIGRLEKARAILFAHEEKNDGTEHPWWGVVKDAGRGEVILLEGPFCSRARATRLLEARRYEYGNAAYVYCFSGGRSQHYRELRELLGPAPKPESVTASVNRLKAEALREWADSESILEGEPPADIAALFVNKETAVKCLRTAVVCTLNSARRRADRLDREGV